MEAVLDPTWRSPYVPSPQEREAHAAAVRSFVLRRRRGEIVLAAVLAVASIPLGITVSWVVALLALVVVAALIADVVRAARALDAAGPTVGSKLQDVFAPGGATKDRQRLVTVIDRLAATFGVDAVSAFIVADSGYNATLVPHGEGYAFYVTDALMRDFELIELEGVVAHCLARQRLGVLGRECASALVNAPAPQRRDLAGVGLAYRADEVAAAAIRYPLGLAAALRKCAASRPSTDSFFASTTYDRWRYVFFDVTLDRGEADLSDLDDATLRAMALEEW